MVEAPENGKSAKDTGNSVAGTSDMIEAPENGKSAKDTGNSVAGTSNMVQAPGTATKAGHVKSLDQFMNLATAPGAEGDIDFDVNDEMGYNLAESDDLKKN